MQTENKERIVKWIKIVALIVWALATIITCAGVWNYCPEDFVKAVAVALFIANGYAIYRKAVLLKKNE